MTAARDSYTLSADEVLASCRVSIAPVNAKVEAARAAHKMAVEQGCPELVRWLTLTSVILASGRTVEDEQEKLDYLTTIPEGDWPPSPAPLFGRRQATLDMLRRSIGWQVANE